MTGTFAGIIPVRKIDDHIISNGIRGELTRELQKHYSKKLLELYPKI